MYVTPEEADGTIGFGCGVTDVICTAQVFAFLPALFFLFMPLRTAVVIHG
jgi:hypothetical protein